MLLPRQNRVHDTLQGPGGGSKESVRGACQRGTIMDKYFLRALAAVLLLAPVQAAAMIEYGPLVREAAADAGCLEPEIQRLGNEGAAIIYTMMCAEGSPVPDGRIRCELESCSLEEPAEATGQPASD